MTHAEQYPGAWQQLVNKINRMERELAQLRSRALRIPILDADPDINDPTNVWMFSDGRLRTRDLAGTVRTISPGPTIPTLTATPATSTGIDVWIVNGSNNLRVRLSDGTIATYLSNTAAAVPNPPASAWTTQLTSSTVAKPTDAALNSYRKVYVGTWAQMFYGDGGQASSWGADYFAFGWKQSFSTYLGWGQLRTMIGFDSATIRADLAGATVQQVELYLNMTDAYGNDVLAHIGGHTYSAAPNSYDPSVRDKSRGRWGAHESAYRNLDTYFGNSLRDDVIRGLVIDQQSTSYSSYGQARGPSSDGPKLRISYTK